MDVLGKAKVSAAEVSIALHGLSGDRFPGRRAALSRRPLTLWVLGVSQLNGIRAQGTHSLDQVAGP